MRDAVVVGPRHHGADAAVRAHRARVRASPGARRPQGPWMTGPV
jgi:hypothetical protein